MDEAMWAFGRMSGVISLMLLTTSVVLGILVRSGRPLLVLPRFALAVVHRNVALMAAIFLALHIGSLMLDPYAQLNLADTVVPFLGAYKPFWQGLGTVALDVLLAVVLTSLLRRVVGQQVFRAVHWLTYALWPLAMFHAIGNGTDAAGTWFLLLAAGAGVAVGAAVVWRLSAGFLESAGLRRGAAR
jgi:methionine sulfoxide reductase heme-binding subunit